MKHCLLVSLLMIAVIPAMAQGSDARLQKKKIDSIKMTYLRQAAIRYTALRQAGITTDFMMHSTIRSELYGKELYNGEVQTTRIKAFLNLPVAGWGKNRVSAAINYQRQSIDISETVSLQPELPVTDMVVEKNTVSFLASYSRSDSLFKIPVLINGSIAVTTDENFRRSRINYIGLLAFQLVRKQHTAFNAGLMAILDPSSPVPVFPYMSLWHRFPQSGLELFVEPPSRIALRKQLSQNNSLSFGTEMVGLSAFSEFNKPTFPPDAIYASLELKTGFTYEHVFSRKVVVGLSAGMLSTLSSRLFDEDKPSKDYFIKNRIGSLPYVSVSVQLLPFIKPLINK